MMTVILFIYLIISLSVGVLGLPCVVDDDCQSLDPSSVCLSKACACKPFHAFSEISKTCASGNVLYDRLTFYLYIYADSEVLILKTISDVFYLSMRQRAIRDVCFLFSWLCVQHVM